MRFKKNGMPYARRRKSWEIPYSERRGKGYPNGPKLFSGRSRRSTKAENEAAAALIIAIISLFFWIVVGAINLCIERYQNVRLEVHTYPHLRDKILKRELYGWGFLAYSGLFYLATATEFLKPLHGAWMLATLPIGFVALFLWARNLSQASSGKEAAETQKESESA